jgi:glycerate kinase
VRVVVAPDKFAGTLSATEAAAAIAAGWRSGAPADELDLVPLSDGGPGFVAVLHAALGGTLVEVPTTDPLGRPVHGRVLVAGDTAYVESAQACGLHLLAPAERDPRRATTAGVAALLRAGLDSGARRVVVGLGGSATNDGGRGMWEALGGRLDRAVELVAATDVDNPLLGLTGASAVFGPQKGASREDVLALDTALAGWADEVERAVGGAAVRDRPGAGAAGGLGFALMALGAHREPGIALVLDAVRLAARVAEAGLVVTGEGSYDASSLRGKVVSGVAALAGRAAVPCVVVAGRVSVGRREAAAAGVDAVYSIIDAVGSAEQAIREPARGLEEVARRVAREWSRSE